MTNKVRFYWRYCAARWTEVSHERAVALHDIGEQVRVVSPGEVVQDRLKEPIADPDDGPPWDFSALPQEPRQAQESHPG
jgi:hypothetical protein